MSDNENSVNSRDYIVGYTEAIESMKEELEKARTEMYKYADRKTFKGISKQDVVFECTGILNRVIDKF